MTDESELDVEIYEDEGWWMEYTNLHGARMRLQLDAETLEDARHEAAHYHNIPEAEVRA